VPQMCQTGGPSEKQPASSSCSRRFSATRHEVSAQSATERTDGLGRCSEHRTEALIPTLCERNWNPRATLQRPAPINLPACPEWCTWRDHKAHAAGHDFEPLSSGEGLVRNHESFDRRRAVFVPHQHRRDDAKRRRRDEPSVHLLPRRVRAP